MDRQEFTIIEFEHRFNNMKTQKEVIDNLTQRVAAGLRKMEVKPVAFLFFDKENSFYDNVAILGIPIYRTSFIYQSNGQDELSFYPLFSDPYFDSVIEVSRFRTGYENYSS